MPLFDPGAQSISFGVVVTMSKNTNPAATPGSLVSFTFSLPADLAALFIKAATIDEITPQQAAAVAAAGYLGAACGALKIGRLGRQEEQDRVSGLNATGEEVDAAALGELERIELATALRRAEVQLMLSIFTDEQLERYAEGAEALRQEFSA